MYISELIRKITMKYLISVAIIVLSFPLSVQARCPADDLGCTNENYEKKIKARIEEGKQNVWDAKGPIKKAKAAGDTITDCADCATKVFTDSITGGGSVDR